MERKGETRQCKICGTAFYVYPGDVNRRTAQLCSYQCAGVDRQGKNNSQFKGKIKTTCQHCATTFEVYPVRIKQGKAKFCSRKCADLARKEALFSVHCDTCEKTLELRHSKFSTAKRHFCSHECYAKANIKTDEQSERTVLATCANCKKKFWALKYYEPKHGQRFCNLACFGAWKGRNANMSHSYRNGGKRDDLNDLYVRSAWEANYARYLNWLQAHGEILGWEYEPETFEFAKIKRGHRSYTPDFKIRTTNNDIEYHEVKGYMDQASQTKLNRMARYYPNIKIILIDKEVYYAVAKTMKSLIPTWE